MLVKTKKKNRVCSILTSNQLYDLRITSYRSIMGHFILRRWIKSERDCRDILLLKIGSRAIRKKLGLTYIPYYPHSERQSVSCVKVLKHTS